MRRTATIFMLAVAVAVPAAGQGGRHRAEVRAFAAGVQAGGLLTDLHYTDGAYDIYTHRLKPCAAVGLWAQWRSAVGLSVRPEAGWRMAGAALECQDVRYRLTAHCVDVRVAVAWHLPLPRSFASVYVVAAPGFRAVAGGQVRYEDAYREEIRMALNGADCRAFDMQLHLGAGFEMPITLGGRDFCVGAEAGYALGLLDNLPGQAGPTVLNPTLAPQGLYGSRRWRGLELALRIGIPFGESVKVRR